MIFLANGGTLSELELRVLYVVIKIMMYDVLLQIIETFPYNDGKIYKHQLKNNINESIFGEKYPIFEL